MEVEYLPTALALPIRPGDFGTPRWQLSGKLHHLCKWAKGATPMFFAAHESGSGASRQAAFF
jgi:hypothetical protein